MEVHRNSVSGMAAWYKCTENDGKKVSVRESGKVGGSKHTPLGESVGKREDGGVLRTPSSQSIRLNPRTLNLR